MKNLNKMRPFCFSILASGVLLLSSCASESSQSLEIKHVNTAFTPYYGAKQPVALGQFDNRSSYMRGVFAGTTDSLGGQARTILETDLKESNRFRVMNRDNMGQISQENSFAGTTAKIQGARYIITGDVTEFGRKEVGDMEFFGLLGHGKSQIAYAKVNLNVVDTQTSEVVTTAQGAGEYKLSNRELMGFGGTASYDSTLNGKVLDLAIREAVNRLAESIDQGSWVPTP